MNRRSFLKFLPVAAIAAKKVKVEPVAKVAPLPKSSSSASLLGFPIEFLSEDGRTKHRLYLDNDGQAHIS